MIKEIMEKVKVDVYGKATGKLRVDNLLIDVEISDVRIVWGRTDYLVTPIQGTGELWVSESRVIL